MSTTDTTQTHDLNDAIVVGSTGEVLYEQLSDFRPSRDFIIRQGELAVAPCSKSTIDGLIDELDAQPFSKRKKLGTWNARPVTVPGSAKGPAWIVFCEAEPWANLDETVSKDEVEALLLVHLLFLDEARNAANAWLIEQGLTGTTTDENGTPDDPASFHMILGLTPGHGLIGEGFPTRSSEDAYFRQRGMTEWRLAQAAALRGSSMRNGHGRPVNVALIDTGLLDENPGQGPNRPVSWDAAIDVDDDDWEPYEVDDNGGSVIGPHLGHATFVASIIRLAAPADAATIHVERALTGRRLDRHWTARNRPGAATPSSGNDEPGAERVWFRLAGVVSEESLADQIDQVHHELVGNSDDPRHTLVGPQLGVINLSLGSYSWDDRPPVVLSAAICGVQDCCSTEVVAAAGNYNHDRVFWPAALDNVISVGALACTQEREIFNSNRAWFSNYGHWVDCYAPGQNVVGTYVRGTQLGRAGEKPSRFGGWACWSGTSVAAPFVSGLLAATLPKRKEDDLRGADRLRAWFRSTNPLSYAWLVGVVPNDDDGRGPAHLTRPHRAAKPTRRERPARGRNL